MGTRMPILSRISNVLSTALLEWLLMLLLFIDGVYNFLVTRFARFCKLPAPCPFCSRLDHVLGNEQPCFYRELICNTHKSEISSLAFCRLHQKLAGAKNMCGGCCEKANDDDKTNEAAMDVNVSDSSQVDDMLNSPRTRICSCCGQHFKQRGGTLSSRKIEELEPTEVVGSPKIYIDYSIAGCVDESLKPKDIYHQSDPHERQSVLQMTPDSEVEVPCADDGKSSHPREANAVEEHGYEDATFELPDIPFPEMFKESERNVQKELCVTDHHDTFLPNNAVSDRSDIETNGNQIDAKDIPSVNWASHHDFKDSKDVDVSQCPVASSDEFPQNLGETEPCQSMTEGNDVPYTSQFTILEQHYAVTGERNIKDNLKEILGPQITATSKSEFHQRITLANDLGTTDMAPQNTHHVASQDAALKGNTHVSQDVYSENIGEVEDCTKKIEPTGDMVKMQDPPGTAPNSFIEKGYVEEACISADAVRPSGEVPQDHSAACISADAVRPSGGVPQDHSVACISADAVRPSGEVPQDHSATEYPKTSESTVERRPSLSTQISMNEAYRLAVGSKSSLPSPTLTDVILGKDSTSSVNEELRLLLSQLSASRGLEAPWVDPGPSPRAYGRGDDLVVQNITKRISLERNASGLESLDGSIVSEMEGESTIDRLRRQIDLDRKSIYLLCRELEEERNASAIAASQALAMITKLQDEKAAMQMEASHYQRMMEEQAEYDSEALAKANELLAEREQQIEELEAELENYKQRFGGGHSPFKQENTNTAFLDEGDLEIPVIDTPKGTTSLASFEDERAYISNCLRKLEQKLQSYSNNSTFVVVSSSDALEDNLSGKVFTAEDDSVHQQERSRDTEEHISLGKEEGSSTMSGEFNLTKVQEEVASMNRRLKTLEGDHNFLEHSINSLRNGNEGSYKKLLATCENCDKLLSTRNNLPQHLLEA